MKILERIEKLESWREDNDYVSYSHDHCFMTYDSLDLYDYSAFTELSDKVGLYRDEVTDVESTLENLGDHDVITSLQSEIDDLTEIVSELRSQIKELTTNRSDEDA